MKLSSVQVFFVLPANSVGRCCLRKFCYQWSFYDECDDGDDDDYTISKIN